MEYEAMSLFAHVHGLLGGTSRSYNAKNLCVGGWPLLVNFSGCMHVRSHMRGPQPPMYGLYSIYRAGA